MTDFLDNDDYPTTPRVPAFDAVDALGDDAQEDDYYTMDRMPDEEEKPVEAADQTTALAVLSPKAQGQVERILALGRAIDLDLPESEQALWDTAIELENAAAVNDAKRGLVYLALKARLPHGEFLPALEARGITPERARESMRISSFLLKIGDENSNRRLGADLNPKNLVTLPKKKLLALAAVPPEVIQQAAEQGELDLDEVALMPIEQVRAECRRLRYQAETDRNQIAALAQKAQLAEHNLSAAMFSAEALSAREEALHGQGVAMAAIDQLDLVLGAVADPLRSYRNDDERAGCAATLYLALGAVQARLTQVITRYQEALPDYASADLDTATRAAITREEAHRARQHLDAYLNKAKIDADVRAAHRQAQTSTAAPVPSARRGRPPGAKDKAPRTARG